MSQLRLIISPVPNWAAARDWYREVLGLEETDGWDREGDRGAFFAVGGGEIEVMEWAIAEFAPLPETDGTPAITLALRVEDLDWMWQHVLGHGAQVLQPPSDRPWGSRDFVIADPNGVPILVFQHDKS